MIQSNIIGWVISIIAGIIMSYGVSIIFGSGL